MHTYLCKKQINWKKCEKEVTEKFQCLHFAKGFAFFMFIKKTYFVAEGLYCPGAKGHESFSDCIWECLPNIVDETSVETPLFQHSLFIYVNFCDINGSANFDPYA